MALLVHLITRRPCAFLVPLVDGAKRNIEQPRNLISREAGFRLNTGLFAGPARLPERLRWVGSFDPGRTTSPA